MKPRYRNLQIAITSSEDFRLNQVQVDAVAPRGCLVQKVWVVLLNFVILNAMEEKRPFMNCIRNNNNQKGKFRYLF